MSASPSNTVPFPTGRAETSGLHLVGIVRVGARELPARWRRSSGGETQTIEYRDLAALVRPAPYRLPEMSREAVESHQREVDGVMQKGSLVPAPFGIIFRDRDGVLRFLGDRYSILDRALMIVEGRWEFRLHVCPAPSEGLPGPDPSMRIYNDLRQIAAAAMPFPRAAGSMLSAAFLVDRVSTRRFLKRFEEMTEMYHEFSLDLTGPWPAYDFVRIGP